MVKFDPAVVSAATHGSKGSDSSAPTILFPLAAHVLEIDPCLFIKEERAGIDKKVKVGGVMVGAVAAVEGR